MSWTKRNTCICDMCGKFCKPYDEWTHFGCKDPEYPEPLDPLHSCRKCYFQHKREWIEKFRQGWRYGNYGKSLAESRAAKKCGLKWVGSGGHGMLGSVNFASSYQYITQEEYDRLSQYPYWGYCRVCESVRKGGYCSNENCIESFKLLHTHPDSER